MQVVEKKDEFRNNLLSWYDEVKRDLPWRRTDNPYYIWVSEVMLQQTRVDTVIPYYERFINRYPTMNDLANAEEDDLLKIWEGLGYYSRVRNLQTGIREVIEQYGGEVPKTRKEIQSLKGIGPYTAGAILSIAFDIPEHAVDGNVMRVISRLLLIEEDIAIPRTKKIFEKIIMDLIDPTDPSSFNQGLMELGATICTPKPACLLCPVQEHCAAFLEGRQEEFPVKSKKKASKVVPVGSFVIRNENGDILLRRRPSKGLLANLWEFPMIEMNTKDEPDDLLAEQIGVRLKEMTSLISFKHIFTHIVWEMNSYTGNIDEEEIPDGYTFFSEEEVESLPKPVPVLKIWTHIKETKMADNPKESL